MQETDHEYLATLLPTRFAPMGGDGRPGREIDAHVAFRAEGCTFVVHRALGAGIQPWAVSEASTGCRVPRSNAGSARKAVALARHQIESQPAGHLTEKVTERLRRLATREEVPA